MASELGRSTEFDNDQYTALYPKGMEHHYWYVARNAFVSGLIRWIERHSGTEIGRILEIGCGRGLVVNHLRGSGRDCYGVELASVGVLEPVQDFVWTGTDCVILPE